MKYPEHEKLRSIKSHKLGHSIFFCLKYEYAMHDFTGIYWLDCIGEENARYVENRDELLKTFDLDKELLKKEHLSMSPLARRVMFEYVEAQYVLRNLARRAGEAYEDKLEYPDFSVL